MHLQHVSHRTSIRSDQPLPAQVELRPSAFYVTPHVGCIGNLSRLQLETLRFVNFVVASMHIISAIVMLSTSVSSTGGAPIPVYTLHHNFTTHAPQPVLAGHIVINYLYTFFFLISATHHVAVATVFRNEYEAGLRRSQNTLRWVEYAVTCTVMNFALAALSGVQSAELLTAVVVMSVLVMAFGALHERFNCFWIGTPAKKSWMAFSFGCLPFIATWVLIFVTWLDLHNHKASPVEQSKLPWRGFFYVVVFLLECCFAVNQCLSTLEYGRWKKYIFVEFCYITLSIATKTFMAWFTVIVSQLTSFNSN